MHSYRVGALNQRSEEIEVRASELVERVGGE
jgi:hypothetical protein